MGFIWFLLGALLGGGLVFFFLTRQSDLRVAEAEMRVAKELKQAQDNAADADLAHHETKERLIALQLDHEGLRAEIERARQLGSGGAAKEVEAAPAVAAATGTGPVSSLGSPALGGTPAAPPGDPNDLKRVKGIGPALERRLNELGVKSLADLADLPPGEVDRINAKLDFPGRIQRERWVEQAKALIGR
jgi:predicted flap endonuclease-1-like 5' DNA nuclease